MIARLLLSRRHVLIACALLVSGAGMIAYRGMPRALEPDVTAPVGIVEAELPGVSVAELEALVTARIEAALLELPDVARIRSYTRDGAAVLLVELPDAGADREVAFGRIDERLGALRPEMQAEFVGLSGPTLRRPAERWPEMIAAVAAEETPVAAARAIARELRALPEVARVEIVGEPRSRIVLTYDDRDLIDTHLTPSSLRDYMRAQSFTAAGGYVDRGETLAPIETRARIASMEELRLLPVRDPDDGDPVGLHRLLDVAREPLSPAPEEVRAGGRPALVLAVERRRGADLDAFEREVKRVLDEARASNGDGVSVDLVVNQAEQTRGEIASFRGNLAQGFALILILLVAALGFRTGLAVALVVPLVVLATLVPLRMGGQTLNVVLLSSLVLVLGLLVDNHIVMAERIHRWRDQGLDAASAIGRALRELFLPLFSASATTVAGFLPVYLTDHFVGQYVRPLFWVVLGTLSVSLLFCVAVTPLLLRRRAWSSRGGGAGPAWYRSALLALSRRPVAAFVLVALVVLCYGAGRRILRADQVFFPASSRDLLSLEVEHAQGTDVEVTRATALGIEQALLQLAARDDSPLVSHVAFVGRSAPPFQASLPRRLYEPQYAQFLLRVRPDGAGEDVERAILDACEPARSGARLRLRPIRLGAEVEWPVVVRIRGPEERLRAPAEEVCAKLGDMGCRNVATDRGDPIEKIRVVPERAELADRNLTAADVTLAMHAVLHGLPVFDLVEGAARTPVVLRARPSRDDRIEALGDAYVYPAKGEPSLLYEVARVETVRADPLKARDRGEPSLTVHAEAEDPRRDLMIEREVDSWLDDLRARHPDLEFEVDGLYASSRRANRALLEGVPWAAALVLIILLLMSRSLVDTALILLAIPLSFVGVAMGLDVTGEPFSFMTLVGMIALAGLVVNNAIVLLASLRARSAEWDPVEGDLRRALIECAGERFRPIVLTTLCAVASMAVLYHGGGPMWRPLAATIISGLSFSALMVLFALPILFVGLQGSPRAGAKSEA